MVSYRRGVFETNSSSTHSISICTEEEMKKWKNNELIFDCYNEMFISYDENVKKQLGLDDEHDEFYSSVSDQYREYNQNLYHEIYYEKSFMTPSGDHMYAFGYYDGYQ